MPTTYVDYTATAAQTDFAFSFDYLEDEHVEVFIDGTKKTLTTDYTIVTSPSTKIVLTSGATEGASVRVRRNSDPSTDLVDFVNGSVLTETELDRAYQHNRYLNEEAFEGNQSSLQTATGSTNFDANFNKIVNLGTPTNSTDAAHKNYVDTLVTLEGTSLSGFNKSVHVGNAVDTVFTLSFTAQTATAAAFIVTLDGVVQVPDTDYTVDTATNQITFTSIVPLGVDIVVVPLGTAADVNSVEVTATGTAINKTLADWTRDLNSPTATGSTTARTLADRFADVVNVLDYIPSSEHSAIRNNTSTYDATTEIQSVLDTYSNTGTPVYFPSGTYVTSATIDVFKQTLIAENATINCSDNSVLAVDISGGSTYTRIYGHLGVGRVTPWVSPASQIASASGVRIRSRVNIEQLTSTGHYWDAINFNASDNLNKCIIHQANGLNSARHGVYFDGTQNDISVWRVNLRCQSNYASGIYFDDNHPARQFSGFWYTEDNGADGTSYGVYTGGLSNSELFVYSEEQTSNNEINLPAGVGGGLNRVFSSRKNADDNQQEDSILVTGSIIAHKGTVGSTTTDQFVNLTDTAAKYWDFKKSTSDGTLFQERYLGNGEVWKVVMDGTLDKFSEFKQNSVNVFHKYSNGTIDSSTPVIVGNDWGLYLAANTGTATRTSTTNFAHFRVEATTVGGGNKGSGLLHLGTARSSSASADRVSIYDVYMAPSNDNVMDLGTAGNRWAVVFAGSGTINTSDDRDKTYLDIEDAEKACALEVKANMRKFKWNDAIEAKGEEGARIHFGTSAQNVQAIFASHGLDASKYGLFCYDEWEAEDEVPATYDESGAMITEGKPAKPAGNRYGIRYDELLCFIMSAL